MVDWAAMEALYSRAGIDVIRVPIQDFDGAPQPECPRPPLQRLSSATQAWAGRQSQRISSLSEQRAAEPVGAAHAACISTACGQSA